ncbi:hypothetical protein LZ30DRAFT_239256 [Colletotrichum cereale]|nr:hypothetical protein LZ30DRAFT_239256 [Colletotrichum cereale]
MAKINQKKTLFTRSGRRGGPGYAEQRPASHSVSRFPCPGPRRREHANRLMPVTKCRPITKLNGQHEHVPRCSSGPRVPARIHIREMRELRILTHSVVSPPASSEWPQNPAKHFHPHRSAASVVQPRRFPRPWVACPGCHGVSRGVLRPAVRSETRPPPF